jgi:hypothetical protein
MQIAGRGRLEAHPPGVVDGARFEGRFVIYSMNGPDGSVFGPDVSLFDPAAVKAHGRGPQSAHFVAVRSGYVLEGFETGGSEIVGHTIGRSAASTRLRVFFDESPDGSRRFSDRASFLRGRLVATYAAEEFFQIDSRAEVFDTRVSYSILESAAFDFHEVRVDLAELAPRMSELSHGHLPEPDPHPEVIPAEEPFLVGGPGVFANHFPVGGALLAVI